MKKETFSIPSPCDHLPLSVLVTEPDNGPTRGICQFVHGMAEMKERYLGIMSCLTGQGYACIIHDHRGHGGSILQKNDLGYMYGAGGKGLVRDAYAVTEAARQRWPGMKLALIGHSMGSLVVRSYVKTHDDAIDALIVMGAPCKNSLVGFARFLASFIAFFKGDRHRSRFINQAAFGSFLKGIDNPQSEYDWLSVNQDNVRFYLNNEYCGFHFTLDGFKGLFDVQKDTYSPRGWQMKNPSLPILFLSGEKDPCIGSRENFNEAMSFMKSRGYLDVKGRLYPGLRHEILNEDCREEIYRDILLWLNRKLI